MLRILILALLAISLQHVAALSKCTVQIGFNSAIELSKLQKFKDTPVIEKLKDELKFTFDLSDSNDDEMFLSFTHVDTQRTLTLALKSGAPVLKIVC